jgi:hypothetical protein
VALATDVSRVREAWALALPFAALLVATHAAGAQLPAPPRLMPELRADVIAGDRAAAHVGAGLQIPVGYYVRIGLAAAGGVVLGEREAPVGSGGDSGHRGSGRVDLLARFLLDPFRQSPYGLSVGGGVSVRADQGDRARPVLLVAIDVEGRRSAGGLAPALQVGLGGGVRVGLILRRTAAPGYR